MRDSLTSHNAIQSIGASFTHPLRFGTPPLDITYMGQRLDKLTTINMSSVGYDVIETLKISLSEGRVFPECMEKNAAAWW